ncbi:hypothetical protein ACH4TS_20160 [Streptomyces albidoflavus]
MSVFDDVAAIAHPMPTLVDVPEDVFNDVCHEIDEARKKMAFNLEMAWDADPEANEPLLSAIGGALYRKAQAEAELRRLVAYGREFTRPRPYKLVDLAAASGMSVSGVRTAYGHSDVDAVVQAIGRKPREWRATAADDPPETGNEA